MVNSAAGLRLSRRGFLRAGLGAAALAAGAGAGIVAVRADPTDWGNVKVVQGGFYSVARQTDVGYAIAAPPGATTLVLSLHGAFNNHTALLEKLELPRRLSESGAQLAWAAVDAGPMSYYHYRKDGTDAGAMIIDEFLPILKGLGYNTDHFALHGISMGGYGAMLLGTELGPERVAGIAVQSPAIWFGPGDAAPGAFDDVEDFEEHNLFRRTAQLGELRMRIDTGTADSFFRATDALIGQINPIPEHGYTEGAGHTEDFWRATLPGQIAFLAAKLGVPVIPPAPSSSASVPGAEPASVLPPESSAVAPAESAPAALTPTA